MYQNSGLPVILALPRWAIGLAVAISLLLIFASQSPATDRPNVLVLYVDDMGFGDLEIQNEESGIATPHLNALAKSGMRFIDAHSSSGICTPSRYALLTGRHHFRKFHGIVNALGGSVFDPDRLTMAEMFQQREYDTACIGKWHLGWDWDALKKEGAHPKPIEGSRRNVWPHDAFDWSRRIPNGPLEHGFDFYFGDTVINFPPYCWIRNDRVVEPPDTTLTRVEGVAKEGRWEARPGPARSDWDFYQVLPTLTKEGVEYLAQRKEKERPFFLYFAFPSPHAPIVPIDEFDDRSQAGPYGDFVMQTDWSCGQLLKALEQNGLADDTLVIFTSDNGPERYAYPREKEYGHWSSAPFRGLKRDIYEGGHHVPMIVRWPGVVSENTVCDELVSQIDLMATLAAILEFPLPDTAAEDSHDLLPLLKGETKLSPRTTHVHNTFKGRFAIRSRQWVMIDGPNGYHSNGYQAWEQRNQYPVDDDQPVELYELSRDPSQRHNVAADHPERVRNMRDRLKKIREGQPTAPRLQPKSERKTEDPNGSSQAN